MISGDGAGNVTFYLDGAHTVESMLCCTRWFKNATTSTSSSSDANALLSERWLMFNCMSERSPRKLFRPLASTDFTRAVFVPFMSSTTHLAKKNESDLKWENTLKKTWDENKQATAGASAAAASACVSQSIGAALNEVRAYAKSNKSKHIHVLVTGSLYLVGDFLRILQRVP